MKEKTPKHLLRRSYMDILRGFTKTKVDKFGEFYFKHLDLFSSEEIDERKREYEEYAVNQGLPTEEEKIKELIKDELWSAEKDKEIENLEVLVSSLKETKAKFYLKRDIDNIQRQVDEETEKLQILQAQRIELVGFTTDSYSTKKINEFFIFNTSFKDRDLTEKFFEKDTFDELHEDDIMLLILNYNKLSQLRYNVQTVISDLNRQSDWNDVKKAEKMVKKQEQSIINAQLAKEEMKVGNVDEAANIQKQDQSTRKLINYGN